MPEFLVEALLPDRRPRRRHDSVPAGTWVYTVTPVEQGWTGGASPASNSITTRLG